MSGSMCATVIATIRSRWKPARRSARRSDGPTGGSMSHPIVTIERHIIDQERKFPEATGAFSTILYDLAFAAKLIAREVNMAGLVDILGGTDVRNIHGEDVQKLDA